MAKANVLTASSNPRTRRAPKPISTASTAVRRAATTIDRPNGQPYSSKLSSCRSAITQSTVEAAGEGGGGEGAEAGEGHLPERQLAGPPGEHRQREGADGEGGDRGVEEVA